MGEENRWWEEEGHHLYNLAKLVITLAAMSEMRTEGNTRNLDVTCSTAPSPTGMLKQHIPVYLKTVFSFISIIATFPEP